MGGCGVKGVSERAGGRLWRAGSGWVDEWASGRLWACREVAAATAAAAATALEDSVRSSETRLVGQVCMRAAAAVCVCVPVCARACARARARVHTHLSPTYSEGE